MESNWPSDCRKFERFLMECEVTITTAEGETLSGWCLDVAEGGLGATISTQLPIGQQLVVNFRLPTAEPPLVLKAIVKYCKGFWYGLEFVSLDARQREAIRAYGRSLTEQA